MVSFHATVIPVLIKSLQTTSTLLDKAEAHAKAKGTPFSSLFSARLVDDMLPLSAQVTITVLFARKGIQLLTTRDDLVAALEYKEYSVEESRAQLEETLEALRKVLPEHVDGKEEEVVQVSMYEKSADVSAKDCTLNHTPLPPHPQYHHHHHPKCLASESRRPHIHNPP
ncbi:uncharacterized protein GGS25DRAFT_526407 [Hypoxylon fragiforme]|uniref:uncharacterized protein n=1 Tax=Hypoxylon fragiforme TaxID=63214 RepID=UPI0020C6D495|nr:uncharacterized protein GGS25DRAFT_526407 [Hypoxylon fragiforme]KAI2603368.1 hypothetical protein GGS25DRAFT_526407 [Hypoxylon fragiforme]